MSNNKWILKQGFKSALVLGLLFFLITIPIANSLELEISPENPDIFEDETITLNLSLKNVNGSSNFAKNESFGNITKSNESFAQFIWSPDPVLLIDKTNIFHILFNVSDNSSSVTKDVSITVTKRNDPPIIVDATSGDIIYESRADLFLELDRESVCKYSFSNKSYSLMEYTFNSNENKTLHNATTPKMSQGTKKIYILCRDFLENYMEEPYIITFDVNLAPTATIYLEPSPPLKSGRVFVELVSSEELASAPELSYTFDDEQSPKIVSLVGSGRRWEGYMIIRGTNIERVGSFSFKGIDLSGIEGTEITDGKLFLIDTNKPGPVQSIEVTNQYDRTRLAWAYSLERDYNIVEYRIYRKIDSGGVDYVDYYKSTTNNYFYDKDVELKRGYYYKVSAVDDAGNEGELSKEVFTTFIPKVLTEPSEDSPTKEIYKLNPALIIVLESKIDVIDQMLLDLNKKEEYFKRISGTENIEVVQSLKILEEVKSAKENTLEIKDEMLNLKSKNLTELEFTDAIDLLINKAQTEFDNAPSEIKIIDSSSYQEFIDEALIEEMAKEYFIAKENNYDSLFEEFIENSISLQDKITVNVLLIESEIVYPKETKNVKTVKKTLNAKETINDAILAESLPKDLSYDFKKLIINEEPTLKADYGFFWEEPKLTKKTIVYSLIDYPDFNTLKDSKLILLSPPKGGENVSGITGLAISDASEEGISPLIIPIIIGIILAGLLGVYYFISVKKENDGLNTNPFDAPKKGNLKELFHSIYAKKEHFPRIATKEFANVKSAKSEDREKLLTLEKEEPSDLIQKSSLFFQKDKDLRFGQTPTSESSAYNKGILKENAFDDELNIENINDTTYFNKKSYAFNKEKELIDIKSIYNDIIRYKQEIERGKEIDINEMQNIKKIIKEIKSACDEIDKVSIENYTEKAKNYLRDTLRYLESMEFAKENSINNTEYKQLQRVNKTKDFKSNINTLGTYRKNYKPIRKGAITDNQNKKKHELHNPKRNDLKIDIHQFAPNNKFFSLKNGLLLRNISELIDYLEVIDKELFFQHANFSKNDFSRWIDEVFGAKELSKSINKILDPKEMRKKIIEFF